MNSQRFIRLPIWIFAITALLPVVFGDSSSRFLTLPQSQSVIEGDPARFECAGSDAAAHHLHYSWTHNGQSIKNTTRVHQAGGTLHIQAVRQSDKGDYACIVAIAANGARQASPLAHLSIIWIQGASVQLLLMSSSDTQRQAILRCRITGSAGGGDGTYEIEWYRNSEKLSTLANIELKRDLLIVHQPTVADNGLYRCLASNAAGRVMSQPGYRLQLPLTGRHAIDKNCQPARAANALDALLCRGKRGGGAVETPPTESLSAKDGGDALPPAVEQLKFVPQPPTTKNLELGTLAKIHCKAQGTPPPQIQWLQNAGEPLAATVEDINGTLTFRNVSAEQRGNYTCRAASAQGQITAIVSVNVVVAPKFTIAPAGQIEAAEMDTVAMHCQALGDPKPTIRWDKDLQYLSTNNTEHARFRFLENGTLEIRDIQPDDEGRYGCTIGSSAGLKREEVRLLVKSAEGALSGGAGRAGEEFGDGGFPITRAVLITMSVAFAYIILVVGLMIWCRYRRQARKARLGADNNKDAESGELAAGAKDEQEPCLPEKKHNGRSASGGKATANGHSNVRGGSGNEAPKSDDTACSNQSKGSKRSQHTYDQLALSRGSIAELIQIGRGEFGDVFVGKIRAAVIRQMEEGAKDAGTEKQQHAGGGLGGDSVDNEGGTAPTTAAEKRRSKTSMDDIEEIKEEQEGDANAANDGKSEKLVLVKALNKSKDEQVCQEFRRQIEMLRAISHKSVVRLYGLCREKDPHYMVLEQTDWGDLKQFLLATAGKVNTSANASATPPPPLKTGQILAVAYQIARGMDAIYRARFIHKDLATRNCVISSDFIVKVSYPALCRDKYSKEYFKHRNSLLPVRWLAPECIPEDEYTTKSDIYAFGVVVWELFHQATKLPFEELSNEELLQRSQAGKLEWCCAPGTPDCLTETLMACWNVNPKERPSFSTICSTLSKSMQNGDK